MKFSKLTKQKILLVFLLILVNFLAYFYLFMLPKRGTGIILSGTERIGALEFIMAICGPGTEPQPKFIRPYDVALNDLGDIYVTDIDADKVFVFNRFGRFKFSFGETGIATPPGGVKATWKPGDFHYPAGIDIDINGNVYVVDSGNRRINIYTSDGNFIRFFPNSSNYSLINPLMVAVYRGKIYVTDRGRIVVFNEKGRFLKTIGETGRERSQLDGPDGIAVGDDGTIYVADGLNMTLHAYSSKGKLKWVVGKPPAGIREAQRRFGLPAGLGIAPDGNIYVADTFHHTIQVYSPQGERLAEVGGRGEDKGHFNFPRGLKVGSNWVIYLADSGNQRVQAVKLLRYEILPEFNY